MTIMLILARSWTNYRTHSVLLRLLRSLINPRVRSVTGLVALRTRLVRRLIRVRTQLLVRLITRALNKRYMVPNRLISKGIWGWIGYAW